MLATPIAGLATRRRLALHHPWRGGRLPPGFGAATTSAYGYPVRPAVGQTCPKRRRTTRDGGPWLRRPSDKPPATPPWILLDSATSATFHASATALTGRGVRRLMRAPVPRSAVTGGTAAWRSWVTACGPHRVPVGRRGPRHRSEKRAAHPAREHDQMSHVLHGTEARRTPRASTIRRRTCFTAPKREASGALRATLRTRRTKKSRAIRPAFCVVASPAIRSPAPRLLRPSRGDRRARPAPSAHCRRRGNQTSGCADSRPAAPCSGDRDR